MVLQVIQCTIHDSVTLYFWFEGKDSYSIVLKPGVSVCMLHRNF